MRVDELITAAGISLDVAVDITSFGDSADVQNRLVELVVVGTKRATAALLRSYRDEGQQIPQAGDLFVVVDGAGVGRCLCRTVRVEIKPFKDVDADFAADEGEGDRTLGYWRAVHRAFFEREGLREGFTFTEELAVVLERFELLYAPSGGGAADNRN